MPLISIILPTWNGSKWLKGAIESVRKQSYQEWELLIIDDGSTDNTAQIVTDYVQNDPRIRYIKNEETLGVQRSLNKGLQESKGEYIARIDDDDEWVDKTKLQKQIDFLHANPDHVLVGTGVIIVNENREELFRYLLPQTDEKLRAKILGKNYFVHSSVLFRKDKALEFEGYSESKEVIHLEDYDLWLKLGTIGKFANLPLHSTAYMVRADSLSYKNRVHVFKKNLSYIKKYKGKYKNYYKILLLSYLRFALYSIYVKFFSKLPVNKLIKIYKKI